MRRRLYRVRRVASLVRAYLRMPSDRRAVMRNAFFRHNPSSGSVQETTEAVVQWLCSAQDESATADGGVARHFGLVSGWSASYPETTGYIIPTLISLAETRQDPELRRRATRMLDWLASIQMSDGAFQGGMINQNPVQAVTFNTGQILLGLCAGAVAVDRKYQAPAKAAAQWLVNTQDADGAWRSHESPFTIGGDKTYYTHVAWGLFEADRIAPGLGFGNAGLRNVYWALSHQSKNGWVDHCCLTDPSRPLTHTLGYFLRGLIEAFLYAGDADLLQASRRTADGLMSAQRPDGSLPGRLRSDWSAALSSTCLTGNVQIAHCWLLLHRLSGDGRYRAAAERAIRMVRSTIQVQGSEGVRGGVAGSSPLWGDYAPLEFLNWAAKFYLDAEFLLGATPEGRHAA